MKNWIVLYLFFLKTILVFGQNADWIPACDATTGQVVYIEQSDFSEDCCYDWNGTNWTKRTDCNNVIPKCRSLITREKCCTYDGQSAWVSDYTDGSTEILILATNEVVENPNYALVSCCNTDAPTIPNLLCDEELPATLTVTRPNDTSNPNWNNENLETNNTLSDNVELKVRITASTPNSANMFGIDSDDPDANHSTIDYTFYAYEYATVKSLQIRENGAFKFNVIGAWDINDELIIRRVNGTVYYYKNGLLVYTSQISSTLPLQAASSFYNGGGVWQSGSISLGEISYCQYEAEKENKKLTQQNRSLSLSSNVLLVAVEPIILDAYNTLIFNDEQKALLEEYRVTEQDLITFITNPPIGIGN